MNDGYSICLNKWTLDESIKDELRILLMISSLSAEKGYCFASNKYFAEIFKNNEETVSRKIKKLEQKGYIKIEYKKHGCQIKERKIRLTDMSIHDCRKCQSTIDVNVKDNNISINNISINNKEIYKERQKEMFLDFWSRYPKKEKKSKTEEWFIKHKLTDKEFKMILNSLDKFKNSNQWKNKQFIPLPITWLNQKRWEDEIEDDNFYKIINEGIIIK